jgi:hypothetical protein
VDLSAQGADPGQTDPGFIKDPMRRAEKQAAPPARAAAAPPPARTQMVTVAIPRGELKPGSTIRIVLDIRVEP